VIFLLSSLYEGNYKKLAIIPLLIVIPLLFLVFFSPGLKLGLELTGGNSIIIKSSTEINQSTLESVIRSNFQLTDLKVSTTSSPSGFGAVIQYTDEPKVTQAEDLINKAIDAINAEKETDAINFSNQAAALLGKTVSEENSKKALDDAQIALSAYKQEFSAKIKEMIISKVGLSGNVDFQSKEISSTLGKASLESALIIFIISGILIIIAIFISFKEFIPSLAVMEAMIFDILAGAAAMAVFNIPISIASISTLLMLVGYSIDTDIMLTSRILNGKEGTPRSRAGGAIKTGIVMTSTIIAALIVMLVFSYYYQIELVFQIALVLFFGLIGDLIATWLLNAPVLLTFVESEKHKKRF
jgi:preprotein translocase subunit SecF